MSRCGRRNPKKGSRIQMNRQQSIEFAIRALSEALEAVDRKINRHMLAFVRRKQELSIDENDLMDQIELVGMVELQGKLLDSILNLQIILSEMSRK